MGEAKRRKEKLGDKYGQEKTLFFGLTKSQAKRFYDVTTRATWVGIGGIIAFWLIFRFFGPAFGWWELAD